MQHDGLDAWEDDGGFVPLDPETKVAMDEAIQLANRNGNGVPLTHSERELVNRFPSICRELAS